MRAADEAEIDDLAMIWYQGWREAHAEILPADLTRLRTFASFRERLLAALVDVRVAGPPGDPLGFCMLKGDELYQLYVVDRARGKGIAAALIADAEDRLAARGVDVAWLTCAIGNERAARLYEKSGWHRAGVIVSQLETPEGVFPLEVWRYQKDLRPPQTG